MDNDNEALALDYYTQNILICTPSGEIIVRTRKCDNLDHFTGKPGYKFGQDQFVIDMVNNDGQTITIAQGFIGENGKTPGYGICTNSALNSSSKPHWNRSD